MCNFRVGQWQASDYSSVLCAEWSLLHLDLQIWVSSYNTEYKDMLKKYVQIYILCGIIFCADGENHIFCGNLFRFIILQNIWKEHGNFNMFLFPKMLLFLQYNNFAIVCWFIVLNEQTPMFYCPYMYHWQAKGIILPINSSSKRR